MDFIRFIIRMLDAFSTKTGYIISLCTTLLVLTVFYDVIMRYVFKSGSIAVQELEWHIFAVIFLLGAASTLRQGGHVRVDILYARFTKKTKAWIDFVGTFVFLVPFSIIIIYSAFPYIMNSWAVREISPDPGGLHFRYALKAMIPLGFSFILLQSISEALKSFLIITGNDKETN